MIEVEIDFKNIDSEYGLFKYLYITLFNIELPEKSNRGAVWDAFSDNFSDIFIKLPPEDYIYQENDKWDWYDYNDYLECLEDWSKLGPKDKNGKKDDMTLVFKNFAPFFKKHMSVASTLLEVILGKINYMKNLPNKYGGVYTVIISIES